MENADKERSYLKEDDSVNVKGYKKHRSMPLKFQWYHTKHNTQVRKLLEINKFTLSLTATALFGTSQSTQNKHCGMNPGNFLVRISEKINPLKEMHENSWFTFLFTIHAANYDQYRNFSFGN